LTMEMANILIYIISSVGLIGNSCSILVLSQREMRSSFNNLLLSLSIYDTLYLFTNLLLISGFVTFAEETYGTADHLLVARFYGEFLFVIVRIEQFLSFFITN